MIGELETGSSVADVAFWPKADMASRFANVWLGEQSGNRDA
jgi:hypothetical protein